MMSGRAIARLRVLSYRLLVLGSILLLAACSQLPVVPNQAQSCKLTIPVIDRNYHNVTIDMAHLCSSDREQWVAYTNTTMHNLSSVHICAQALNPIYCGLDRNLLLPVSRQREPMVSRRSQAW